MGDGRGSQNVLVTGAAGFVGSHLADALLQDGCRVTAVDCFNDNYGRRDKMSNLRHLSDWDAFEFIPLDLAQGALDDIVEGQDVIFHLAAEPGVRTSWGDRYERYLRNNILASQHLLDALRLSAHPARLVLASSSSVYGDSALRPTPESAPLNPRSPYGQTKAAAEMLANLYRENFGVDVVTLRYFTVFGPRQRPDMAFTRLCRAALSGEQFTVFGDGRQTRDFTFVSDVVQATIAAATADLPDARVFNIGGGSPASLRDAIEVIDGLVDGGLQVTYAESEHGDVRDTAADTTLARRHLGYTPTTDLARGLADQFAWVSSSLNA